MEPRLNTVTLSDVLIPPGNINYLYSSFCQSELNDSSFVSVIFIRAVRTLSQLIIDNYYFNISLISSWQYLSGKTELYSSPVKIYIGFM